MTSAVWSSASATDGANRAAAKIPHFHDLRENSGALLFEVGKGVRQRAPPILTYHYVRIMPTKKANCRIVPYMSRTHLWVDSSLGVISCETMVLRRNSACDTHHGG